MVGRVSRNGSYCSSDTNWKARRPGQLFETPFQDIKIRLALEAIPEPGLQEAFDQSIQFIRDLTNENNMFDKSDVLCGNPNSRQTIPFSHSLFESRNKFGETKYPEKAFQWLDKAFKSGIQLFTCVTNISFCSIGTVSEQGLKTWQIEEWPTFSNETLMELNKIRDSHRAMPLPAFIRRRTRTDGSEPCPTDWSLMKPATYGNELPNSVVLITFHLVHFAIKGKDIWNIVPYTIRSLSGKMFEAYAGEFNPLDGENASLILGSPSVGGSASSTPVKRRRDNVDDTPSKKRKCT
jgi:hypothetical protein